MSSSLKMVVTLKVTVTVAVTVVIEEAEKTLMCCLAGAECCFFYVS
tara:strand:- start:23 stop:160 length:138 start_codon:yes stop_codon:yes gene_type:complete